ncbi:carbamoyltransferase HypF [Parazoarcus communis]|uniref:Carbamoyltransferase HypF n=1 Tax=Parazoarcus communis TaxID=41977 RepID=A0A2U8GKL6_9RHOO|nr:carbamoyltransferase HypF [Parazoarcus communis]AWI73930.1 carbamoyltransferase HypF [Parazoarcus communis]
MAQDFSQPRLERRHIRVRGVVQGVGFRPFVYRLAQTLDLSGWVRNDGDGVELEGQGLPGNLSALIARIRSEAPSLARVDSIHTRLCDADPADQGFTIRTSESGAVSTTIGHDSAVCADCLAELFDPADRRWRYPFINCTHCGPRYTITRALPYDRSNTSMATFAQCPACQREYDAPVHRRFHAEPNACADCGPQLSLLEAAGVRVATRDPIADTLLRLLTGEIVAIKGLGGFHLVCDARNPEAVERLRARKGRGGKPFAVMVANLASARRWARLASAEEALLAGAERPVVLCEKRPSVDNELWGLAPDLGSIGLMLPYTPLHYLLFHDNAGRPSGTDWLGEVQDLALVMTSANPGGEPLVTDNQEALQRLKGIADAYLMHDRDILSRCDDSVMVAERSALAGARETPRFVRRARGFTPRSIRLAQKGVPVLAFGAWLKNAVCLTRGDEAFLSEHIGDLDNPGVCVAMDQAAEHLQRILAIQPEAVAHDLHPDFHSTRAALALADRLGVPAIGVQHHHAHIAAVLAEHRRSGPVLGVALDGVGLGSDGSAWGGELLTVDGAAFERVGHLAPLALPGGDQAARAPWRMAASALHRMGRGADIAPRFATQRGAAQIKVLLDKPHLCPTTTSMGRWFDAAAGLLGVCERMDYDAEAAMRLESLAASYGSALRAHRGWAVREDESGAELDLLPLLAELARERNPARGAAVFHATLLAALEDWIVAAARHERLSTVALGGGCFLNRQLAFELPRRLSARGLEVLTARQAPCNDGGIALGQAWVAIQQLQPGN